MTTGRRTRPLPLEEDPSWYKEAIIYQVHVRSFADSNADGIGDFKGLTGKLDYIRDLGVTTIWLLPFYPSPLRDDGYDISDYQDVHPDYGTIRDFKTFLDEAHERGLRVVTELVLNHTSDQHRWFQRARRAKPGSQWRDFYVWNDNADKYKDARIIFKDFETSNWSWDAEAGAYFWHRFYHHQPDLNFDSPAVRRELLKAVDFWFRMGVDGLRLDAVPYLYEREGTTGENLLETHMFLKALRKHVDTTFKDKMLLAEANQWPEDAVAYFGEGDECHMAFHFPVMPRLFMASRMEDRYPIVDILQQTPTIPGSSQWALFLRNHDELTLEMVTDEERDYMYRYYARDSHARINLGIRRRLAPLLENDRRKIELLNGLLFSLPGSPIVYYGDEIGMGDNFYLGDRNGMRTPMQWSTDRNAGFSQANPQRLFLPVVIDPEFHYEALNVEAQQANGSSLLWWMKRLISLRKQFKVFGSGSLDFLFPENRKILAFVRRNEDVSVLVVANLSRFTQSVQLDLSAFEGAVPVELFGRSRFPRVEGTSYHLTLGPHAFLWFALEAQAVEPVGLASMTPVADVRSVTLRGRWEELLSTGSRVALASILLGYIRDRRWFSGKARTIQSTEILDVIPVDYEGSSTAHIVMIRIAYSDGEPETYVLPIGFAAGDHAAAVASQTPQAVVARIRRNADEEPTGILYESLADPAFTTFLIDVIDRRRRFAGEQGEITGAATRAFRRIRGSATSLDPVPMRAEQSNTSIVYGNQLILKLFRRSEAGINPDLELGRYLTDGGSFSRIAPVAGAIEYEQAGQPPATIAVLQGYVANEGDAWSFTVDAVGPFYERVLSGTVDATSLSPSSGSPVAQSQLEIPSEVQELIGPFIESARLLGRRTAELHRALGAETGNQAFAPEAFTFQYQRSLVHSLVSQSRSIALLRQRAGLIPDDARTLATTVLRRDGEITARFNAVRTRRITATRTRIHGDYHLGQVLHTGSDFVIIDFEGEPARPLSERKIKRSPLRDVAGMLRSFHYASLTPLVLRGSGVDALRPEDVPGLLPWANVWYRWVSGAFLESYLETAAGAAFIPVERDGVDTLLSAFLIEKATYEIGYELNNRPNWVKVPLLGLLDLLGPEA